MSSSHSRPAEAALPGGLDHSRMTRLLGYNLAQASVPSNKVFDKHIAKVYALKQVEFTILQLASSNRDLSSKQLALALNIPAPNLSVILDRLQARELLKRTRSEADRRVQFIRLTAKGTSLANKADATASQMEQELLRHLSDAEQAMLFELLRKVAVHRKV
ncbi:MarR family transcriptional regulator [uncultured Ramlibacter sp.]|uniref:MarR family winged helix-turn-helix transcriptional regulator n=1 Tax=uncultured Ramlibacter sp. TaxID=260755 RepID=UPI0026390A95|nr:MarR family transcriptional regulator [uncultured Ramlibacter sp.]